MIERFLGLRLCQIGLEFALRSIYSVSWPGLNLAVEIWCRGWALPSARWALGGHLAVSVWLAGTEVGGVDIAAVDNHSPANLTLN